MKLWYLRNNRGFPVGCIATNLDRDKGIVLFGVSSYNHHDKFSKSEARKQAIDRLETTPRMVALSSERGKTKQTILKRLVELNHEGYKPVSHTVAEAASHQLKWDEVTEFWNQWKYRL